MHTSHLIQKIILFFLLQKGVLWIILAKYRVEGCSVFDVNKKLIGLYIYIYIERERERERERTYAIDLSLSCTTMLNKQCKWGHTIDLFWYKVNYKQLLTQPYHYMYVCIFAQSRSPSIRYKTCVDTYDSNNDVILDYAIMCVGTVSQWELLWCFTCCFSYF